MPSITVPIDITAINNTAREMQPEIRDYLMSQISEKFPLFRKYPGSVRQSADIVYFRNGKIMGSYNPDLTTKASNQLGILSKRTLTVRKGMGLIVDEVERYRNTYMGTLADLKEGQKKLPFGAWYVEKYKSVGLEDISTLPWQGVYNDGGANPHDIADGFLRIIADEVTATNISTANGNYYELSGAATDYTASNIGDELKAQYTKFPEKTQNAGVTIHIPYRYKQMYKEWFKNEYSNITDGDVPTEYLDGTDKKARFNWDSEMGTTKRVIMCTLEVLTYGMDGDSNEFGLITTFWYSGNLYLLAGTNTLVIGFQIGTLDSSMFNVNNLA
jgi:hypothetical protein